MTLPLLTPALVRQLSPDGRLTKHETILAQLDAAGMGAEVQDYARSVQLARTNWDKDRATALLYLGRADAALVDLEWRQSKEVAFGEAQIANLAKAQISNAARKSEALEHRVYAQAFALTTDRTKTRLVRYVLRRMNEQFPDRSRPFSERTIRRYLEPIMQKE